ncbi:hypothetical protein LRP52_23820 [Photobacterium sp. ZSDE20]|uniref:Peptidase M50 domain-containing protein n=1 Tax=Photobacterium pectinilyticum TaxID=2906793 RepID=A0ABT1N0Z1_9GAMM|nr:hypothetical protein [Photobacterium sp. ZSDE20]MCQ1058415.1 hypothetical protein [Photobacterium sp. ZSDE20]MDD1825222.1 hypothetical protein [Photobacterium sp. ZSDE20]
MTLLLAYLTTILAVGVMNRIVLVRLMHSSRPYFYVMSMVGVVCHEISHYLFCKLGKHQVTSVCLYDPKARKGCLGYVEHSYNTRSIYQVAFLPLIALAPLIVGNLVAYCFTIWLYPQVDLSLMFSRITVLLENGIAFDHIGQVLYQLSSSVAEIHLYLIEQSWVKYLVWMWFCATILYHAIPSRADFKGTYRALPIVFILALIVVRIGLPVHDIFNDMVSQHLFFMHIVIVVNVLLFIFTLIKRD